MADKLSCQARRRLMQSVRRSGTKPEMIVRKLVFGLGYRYRLHVGGLPGTPDIVFPGRRKVIFVHGCFWHRHRCRQGRSVPATNASFWLAKFRDNVARDRRQRRLLRQLGWQVLTVWECETKKKRLRNLDAKVRRFLEED